MQGECATRLVVVAESALSREGLKAILGRASNFDVLAACPTPQEACEAIDGHPPDIVLVDLEGASVSPDRAWTCLQQSSPAARLVFILPRSGNGALGEAFRVPATAYVTSEDLENGGLLHALDAALRDEATVRVSDLRRAQFGNGHGDGSVGDVLTEREREVLLLVASGCHDREIAEKLVLSVSAIRKHIHHVTAKLESRTRAEAVARAVRKGLI